MTPNTPVALPTITAQQRQTLITVLEHAAHTATAPEYRARITALAHALDLHRDAVPAAAALRAHYGDTPDTGTHWGNPAPGPVSIGYDMGGYDGEHLCTRSCPQRLEHPHEISAWDRANQRCEHGSRYNDGCLDGCVRP